MMKYLPLAPIILALALCGACDDPFGGGSEKKEESTVNNTDGDDRYSIDPVYEITINNDSVRDSDQYIFIGDFPSNMIPRRAISGDELGMLVDAGVRVEML